MTYYRATGMFILNNTSVRPDFTSTLGVSLFWRRLSNFVIITCAGLLASSAYAADFRDASWGMTMAQVKSLHAGEIPANQRQAMVNYDGKLAGLDVLIYYRFNELGGLYQAGYQASLTHADQNVYITEYNQLNSLLRRRYPESPEPEMIWNNRLFETKPDNWGRAVALGHLTYQWSYSTGNTRIKHELNSDKRRHISHQLSYEVIADAADTDILDEL